VVDARGTARPVRAAIHELVDDLTPTARRLGWEDELALVPRILEHGASYQRQRRLAAGAGGELRPVVEALLEEMRVGLPS